tara:strand:- start:300 stop:878 length:579 start_codon:yes stop_codon:yes gene_type:complete
MDLSQNRTQTHDIEKGQALTVPLDSPQNNIKTKPESKTMTFMVTIGFCSIVLLALALIGASIAYYVLSIMSLVRDSNESIQNECKNSNIWAYLLTVMIVNLIVLNNSKPKDDEGNAIMSCFISLLITIGLCTWGSIEFWNDCIHDNFSNTLIFKMVQITIYIQYSVIFIIIAVIIFILKKISGSIDKNIQRR